MHHCILDIHHKVSLTYINHFCFTLSYITSVSISRSCPFPICFLVLKLVLRLGRDVLSKIQSI